ncbi:MAG: DUF692 domain-containing protein [Deltaproteobacteria bacterium]|nr:DUF692 domain-containing protein [Deltaproteobacteria bacterium]
MTATAETSFPRLGCGIGLRREHYAYILEHWPALDWFEIISENFLVPGGRPLWVLDQVRERYSIVMHGVSMSIGSSDPLDFGYLRALQKLAERVRPAWVSDHLCWTGVGSRNAHDLLPLPYTEETIAHVARRVRTVQEVLERPILLENVSSYLTYRDSVLCEWDCLGEIARRAGCFVLLDVNNVYVSAFNHRFDPLAYLRAVPAERVVQFHLAGHTDNGTHLLDTHDHPIIEPVWRLYEEAVRRFGPLSTLIERDARIPEFPEVAAEADRARQIQRSVAEAERRRHREPSRDPAATLAPDQRA